VKIRAIVNCSDQRAKNLLLETVRQLEGEQRIEITQHRPRRSDRQLRWYWPGFVQPFADWLSERQGHRVTTDVAHSILKESLLREPVVTADGEQLFDHRGDPLMRTRSTRELNTVEFNEYLDRCGELLVEMEVIREMPEPRRYHERITAR
jgi:hypothetical protein